MHRQHYIDRLLEHYESSRYRATRADADVVLQGINPGCGDIINIYLNVGEGNIATEIWFDGEGCIISQGAVSILLEMVQGRPLAEIEAIDYNELVERLGKHIVLTRVRCATLGLKTLKDAIQHYHTHQHRPPS